jgi:intracellular sulfur oxidation DsrE/DsrF family protein
MVFTIKTNKLSNTMKKYLIISALCALSLTGLAQIYPAIKNGGVIYNVPEAESVGEWKQPYKIVTEIMNGVDKRDSLNPGLERMARLVNLYRHAGVPSQNIDLVIMIHFTATPIILTDDAYRKRYGVPNPNTALINEMAANGVKFYVCGQSLYRRKFVNDPRNPSIKVVLSAMYGITTLQMQGYAFMP